MSAIYKCYHEYAGTSSNVIKEIITRWLFSTKPQGFFCTDIQSWYWVILVAITTSFSLPHQNRAIVLIEMLEYYTKYKIKFSIFQKIRCGICFNIILKFCWSWNMLYYINILYAPLVQELWPKIKILRSVYIMFKTKFYILNKNVVEILERKLKEKQMYHQPLQIMMLVRYWEMNVYR